MNAVSPIGIDPEIQGGTPCFTGTRVQVRSLFDALKRGRSVEYFLSQFPAVSHEQVDAIFWFRIASRGDWIVKYKSSEQGMPQ